MWSWLAVKSIPSHIFKYQTDRQTDRHTRGTSRDASASKKYGVACLYRSCGSIENASSYVVMILSMFGVWSVCLAYVIVLNFFCMSYEQYWIILYELCVSIGLVKVLGVDSVALVVVFNLLCI